MSPAEICSLLRPGIKNGRFAQTFKATTAPEVTSDKTGRAKVDLAPKSVQVLVKQR